MAGIEDTVIREVGTHSAQEYARRVTRLALAYVTLFLGSLAGIGLLVWQAQLYVTLAQRSNVETLVLGFFLVFFAYVAIITAPGAWGALRLGGYAVLGRVKGDAPAVARRKVAALGAPSAEAISVGLNLAIDKEGGGCAPFRLQVADAIGGAGTLEVDGAEVRHCGALRRGSNSLLAYFVHQVQEVLRERGVTAHLDIVVWKSIDDEAAEQHLGLVRFARNLEAHLGAGELWPKVVITEEDCAELERRLSAVCPALRNEAFLPDWEYEAEHQVPLVPEPLGLVSLRRSERRVDPVTSMGCAVLVVGAAVAALTLFVLFPPWVPGK